MMNAQRGMRDEGRVVFMILHPAFRIHRSSLKYAVPTIA